MYTRYIIMLAATLMLNLPVQAETEQSISHKDTAGFGIGTLVGAVLGGPIGAVAGAAGGSWLGAREADRDRQRAELAGDLAARTAELEQLKSELAALEARESVQSVRLDHGRTAAQISEALNVAVYFRTDSSELETAARQRLEKIAAQLREYPQIRVHVAGHADRRGSPAYNRGLSRRRAESVAHLLQATGIDPRRIHIEAHGQAKASAPNGDLEGYVFDRRVSIELSLRDPV